MASPSQFDHNKASLVQFTSQPQYSINNWKTFDRNENNLVSDERFDGAKAETIAKLMRDTLNLSPQDITTRSSREGGFRIEIKNFAAVSGRLTELAQNVRYQMNLNSLVNFSGVNKWCTPDTKNLNFQASDFIKSSDEATNIAAEMRTKLMLGDDKIYAQESKSTPGQWRVYVTDLNAVSQKISYFEKVTDEEVAQVNELIKHYGHYDTVMPIFKDSVKRHNDKLALGPVIQQIQQTIDLQLMGVSNYDPHGIPSCSFKLSREEGKLLLSISITSSPFAVKPRNEFRYLSVRDYEVKELITMLEQKKKELEHM